jgi:hypothetical protein
MLSSSKKVVPKFNQPSIKAPNTVSKSARQMREERLKEHLAAFDSNLGSKDIKNTVKRPEISSSHKEGETTQKRKIDEVEDMD